MCGITAIYKGNYTEEQKESILTRMTASLHHRGPDAWGLYLSNEIAFGHTRLSIVDLADGHQPMDDGRFVLVYNGEVYNHIELRKELESKGIRFKTRSDTEVVLKSFSVWGADCFQKFNGQFAGLIWDRQEKRLVAFRDRYGIRPLYMLTINNARYFASETKAFDYIPQYTRSFNIRNLIEHGLLWNTLGEKTVFNDIVSIPSASFMVLEQGKDPVIRKYYTLGETGVSRVLSIHEAQEELVSLLRDSVRLRLRSDVPVGAYLSGGIDSSVITALTSQINHEPYKTFSVGFEDTDFDESAFQQKMVERICSEHASLSITYDDINSHFMNSVYHCERPVFRTAPVPLFLLSNCVKQNNIKVVLTGEASDEILFGYDSFKELKLLNFWSKVPGSQLRPQLIKRLYPHLHHYRDPEQFGFMKMYYEGFLNQFDSNLVSLTIRVANNSIIQNYFNKDRAVDYSRDQLIEDLRDTLPAQYDNWSLLRKNQYLEMQTLLSGYLLSSQGDRMSLAHSVEGRYPFLDHRLVEAVFSYPDEYKLRGFSQKHILRQAFKDMIPDSIINRPKLPYQAPDLKAFIQNGAITDIVDQFLSPETVAEFGIFDAKMVARFIRKNVALNRQRIGYRDNMIMVFLLSAQISQFWMQNPPEVALSAETRRVRIVEHDN